MNRLSPKPSLLKLHIFTGIMTLLMFSGCADRPERHLDLGLWYYQKGLVDDAIMEFKEVIRLLPENPRDLDNHQLEMVARAHHNLAAAYSKKGWFEIALREAERTFELHPTPENYDILGLIQKRQNLEQLDSKRRPH